MAVVTCLYYPICGPSSLAGAARHAGGKSLEEVSTPLTEVIHADPPTEHKAYLHRSGRTARAGAAGVVITVQSPAQSGDVRVLMRQAGVAPLTASVSPGSALLRSIAGPPAGRAAQAAAPAVREAPATAAPATGSAAVALSAGYRGRRRR